MLFLLSAADLTDMVTKSIATGALLLGGAVGFWKFVLQQPFGPRFRVEVEPCRVRRVVRPGHGEEWAYTVNLIVENQSQAKQRMVGFWRCVHFPDERRDDPDKKPPPRKDNEADDYFEGRTQTNYWLSPGQRYVDAIVVFRPRLYELCYVQFQLTYVKRDRRRDWFFSHGELWAKRQILTAPVAREDLTALAAAGTLTTGGAHGGTKDGSVEQEGGTPASVVHSPSS